MRPMKDSGVAWLGQIPESWVTVPLWVLFNRTKRTGFADERLLSVYRDHGVVPKDSRDDNHNVESADLSNYQLVEIGDLAVNKMKAWQGSISISTIRGIVSPAYFVFSKREELLDDRYAHYLLRSHPYIFSYSLISKGVRIGQWDLQPEYFRQLPALVPPPDEQEQIADYLDKETSKIDLLISKKEQLIEKLLERRQALITQVVTKGRDADLIGEGLTTVNVEVPNQLFRYTKIKHVAKLSTGSSLSDEEKSMFGSEQNDTFPYVSSKDVDPATRTLSLNVDLRIPKTSKKYRLAKPGSFLMVVEGGSAGRKMAMVESPVFYVNKLCNFSGDKLEMRWLFYFVQSEPFRQQFNLAMSGMIGGVSISKLGNFIWPVARQQDLQYLLGFLDEKTREIDSLVSLARQSIETLDERKHSLVNQVVTGKLDVRGLSDGDS